MSRAERPASSALRNSLESRVSASAVADLIRVESTRVSLSFPLIPSLTDELRCRVPVSAVLTFPYTVDELLRRVPVSAVRLFLIQLRSYSAVFLFLPYVHFLIQRAGTHITHIHLRKLIILVIIAAILVVPILVEALISFVDYIHT